MGASAEVLCRIPARGLPATVGAQARSRVVAVAVSGHRAGAGTSKVPLPEPGKGFLAAVRLTGVILPGPVVQRAASGRPPGDDRRGCRARHGDGCGCYRWWLSRVPQVLRGVGRVLAGPAGGERFLAGGGYRGAALGRRSTSG